MLSFSSADLLYERRIMKAAEEERTPVAKDRDRIIHSAAFRRLQGKSQVFSAHVTDFFRNRLTHTLECAQIGRAIAARLSGASWGTVVTDYWHLATLVEAACLAHDLGHPPFGHNGEEALSDVFQSCVGKRFEGNAQSFRIVTYIEPKEVGEVAKGNERWVGLNLTRTTLRAICKYPWLETDARVNPKRPKFSCYDDMLDRDYFDWVWQEEQPKKTLATEIMDIADDIAYASHDFEDGVWANMIPLHDLMSADEGVITLLHRKVVELKPEITLDQVYDDLRSLFESAIEIAELKDERGGWMKRPFERTRDNVSYLKSFTAALIEIFIEAVSSENEFRLPSAQTRRQIDALTGIAWVWMIDRSDLATRRHGQRKIIHDLFEAYIDDPSTLPRQDDLREIERSDLGPEAKHELTARLVCDHIAGMTDHYALRAHEEMFSGKSPFEIRYAY